MEAPIDVVIGLRNIRSTLNLRWNPEAVMIAPGTFDADGFPVRGTYDGRWELWDKVDAEPEYKVMTLQTPEGHFRPPGQWIVELFRKFNPARYGGDPNKMLDELMYDPQQLQEDIADADADDLFEMVAKWEGWRRTPKGAVLTDNCSPMRN